MEGKELTRCFETAQSVAYEAGSIIKEHFHQPKSIMSKGGNSSDLVTITDQGVEKIVKKKLLDAFPDFKFFGEEEAAAQGIGDSEFSLHLTPEPTWIIDPVDGTTNFCHTVPWCCISMGLAVKGEPILGVVYNPILNEMFTGVKGRGAFLNGKEIHTSGLDNLQECLFSFDMPTLRNDPANIDFHLKQCRNLLLEGNVHAIRNLGSCALDMCSVACGRFDAHCSHSIHPWDTCAAAIIVREAGGYVADPRGTQDFTLTSGRVLAGSSRKLIDSAIEVFEHYEPDKRT